MPRDGSNIYHYPAGIEGVPDTPVQSAPYNSFLADVEQDLNAPRPILAGGTGANSAPDALAALSGEQAGQAVDNYDSFPFKAGSFYSAASATAAPNTHAFSGICYLADASNVVVEARDASDGKLYVRRKVAGVWGAWSLEGDLSGVNAEIDAVEVSVAALQTNKLDKAGGTMTGALVLAADGAAPLQPTSKGQLDTLAAAVPKLIGGQTFTGGFGLTSFTLGVFSGTVTPNPMNSNYQHGTNNGAFTLAAPTVDCAIDIMVFNGTAGTITFTGFTVNAANAGDPLTNTNGHRFIISIRRIAGLATYVVKALQ